MTELPLDDAALYELYHRNIAPLVSTLEPDPSSGASAAPSSKTYRRAERVPLADPEQSAFLDGLSARASYTDASERRPITGTELATLLAYAYGERRAAEDGTPRRPVPSGGARYPLELYPVVVDSPDIAPGLYHFDVRDDALERLQEGNLASWIQEQWTWVTADDAVAAVVLITARPERAAERYGEMGYLFAAIETGAVVQNLQLVATELGIGSRPHNGLDYRALRQRLGLRDDEFLMSTVVFAGVR